jgi:DAK2 domain fusion protein YloV
MPETDMASGHAHSQASGQAPSERQIRLAAELPMCDGAGFRRLTRAALEWLQTNHQAVNALNVFPVPDGDTGTNMLLTMQAAWREIEAGGESSVSRVAHAVAHGALMGARGNSGVILSQILRGFARGLGHAEAFDTPGFVQAMREASDTAYRGVVKPVEGTILTVIKDVAAAAERTAEADPGRRDLRHMLDEMVAAANASVQRTPELLPVLKQAGVVDSGGKGLAVLLEGMQRYLRGQRLDASQAPVVAPLDLSAVGAAMDAVEPGQEWEVVVDFRPNGQLHLPTLHDRLTAIGTSIQVGEGEGIYRVHVHLLAARRHEPLALAEEFGTVVNVHMENLLAQLSANAAKAVPPLPLAQVEPGQIAVVAVSPGAGLSRVMASLGAAAIVNGGQTMNPSTQDILEAVGTVPTDHVIVLPNNKNIILAAEQAAGLSVKHVRVVPTRTVPQGIAALLKLIPDGDLEAVGAEMEQAREAIETGEVTRASRSVEINGVAAREGEFIGMHNGDLAAADASAAAVLLALLRRMRADDHELITLYHGQDVPPDEARAMAHHIAQIYPDLEVQVHDGGQPHYHYILSAE